MTKRAFLLFAAAVALGACRSMPAGESTAVGESTVAGESTAAGPALVDVGGMDPSLLLDMRYATPDNFLGRAVYDAPRCLLADDAARRLLAAERTLRRQGYRLVVWDCYRPRSVQWLMWEILPDETYIADPRKGSRHNRGAAVDVGLRTLDGSEVPLPTPHDDFTPRAARDYMELPPEAIANRERLERAMTEQGWIPLPSEWWHFDAPGWERYPLRNEPLAPRGSSTRPMVGDSIDEAVDAAERWLRMIDAGDYAGSWDAAAELAQSAVSQDQWIRAIEAARAPLGPPISRTLKNATFTRSLPNAPAGDYVVIVYESSFANRAAVETVTPMRDPDGEWRVSGYFIR